MSNLLGHLTPTDTRTIKVERLSICPKNKTNPMSHGVGYTKTNLKKRIGT